MDWCARGRVLRRKPRKFPCRNRTRDSIFSMVIIKRVLITSVIRTFSGLDMPYLLIDYSKCTGSGECVTSCPGSVFEKTEERCKPIDHFVKNTIALEYFRERITCHGPIPVAIRYHVPECFLCWQCIGACPTHAIDVEYDDLDIREFLLPTEKSAILTS